ncbi:MAG: RraA family protein [Alphaproteobacteria bacterium]|nr:RraA family protein [Alphaproteobacteria bacterium]
MRNHDPSLTMSSDDLVDGFATLATSTIGNVLDELGVGGLIVNLPPLVRGRPFCGPAVTAQETCGSFGTYEPADFRVGAIQDAAGPGDVVVIANDGVQVSTWGGLASLAAARKGIAGAVIDGGARDIEEIESCGFAICARHLVPTGGRKRIKVESIGEPVTVDGVRVSPGDIIAADGTGIACIPRAEAEAVLEMAQAFAANDRASERLIEGGASLSQAMGRFDTI